MKQFQRSVQASPSLAAQISEYLKSLSVQRPIDDARTNDAAAPALSNIRQRYPSTVFPSPPPSTIGRGEQALSPSFLAQRKQDTWPEFVAHQKQQQQDEQGFEQEGRGATPRPNNAGRFSGSLLDTGNPLIDADIPSTPSLIPGRLFTQQMSNNHSDTRHLYTDGGGGGGDDDDTVEPQSDEEAVQLFKA